MSISLPILNSESPAADDLMPGKWWHVDGKRIVCDLCPRRCALKDGDRGFCFVRQNVGNQMVLTTYGRSTGFCVDPIEKKPLNHFYPGTSVLSFGTAGCNLGCKFCQNWDISKSREIERLSERALPEDIARAAQSLGCKSVAFTYNDPVIWAEYAIDTARACRDVGIHPVAVTAGYITEEAREPFFQMMDAANVDLKAFTEEFYHRLTLSHLEPVLETLRWLKAETDVWFEITNLVIPDANDRPDELKQLCDWVLENVGDEVPVHFTAFHPDFRMRDRPRTPPETLNLAREIGLKTGLNYVYTGNVDDVGRQSTYCPNCEQVVIERNWYQLGRYALSGGRCVHCGHRVAGHFEDQPGQWGRRRLPVNMQQFTSQPLIPLAQSPGVQSPRVATRGTSGSSSIASPHDTIHQTETSIHQGDAPMTTATQSRPELTEDHKTQLLRTTAELVTAASLRRPSGALDMGDAGNHPVAGVFVSLKRKGRLRGCCGSFGQMMPLAQALQEAAVRTATEDYRFPPVSPVELPHLDLEVWVLHSPVRIAERGLERVQAVQVGTHGLQVVLGTNRGLLLPSVPVEHGWDAEEFLNQVCIKAGLPPTAWKDDDATLLRFEGDKVGNSLCELLFRSRSERTTLQTRPLLTGREFAAYVQHCRSLLEAFLTGATPMAYCPTVSDANVKGVTVIVSRVAGVERDHPSGGARPPAVRLGASLRSDPSHPSSDTELTVSRLSVRQTMPLQATLFALCQELAAGVRQWGIRSEELDIHIAVADDPAMHGTVEDPDLAGVDVNERCLLVADRNKVGWVYDRNGSPEELLDEASQLAQVSDAATSQVFSLALRSTRSRIHVASLPRPVQGSEVRPPAVGGTFYPADPNELTQMLDAFLQNGVKQKPCTAAMVPHAGWQYSGRLAADVLKRIEFPKTIIALGPKHTPHGVEWAVAPHQTWSLPAGNVASDPELARRLAEAIEGLELDAAAHAQEHGVEVELPLIARLSPEARVVGIAVGGGNLQRCERFAQGLAEVIDRLDEPPLLLISSDMNHFATDAETRRLDEMALAELDRLDPDALYETVTRNHISMCGVLPAVIVLKTLKRLNRLTRSERVGYATTADTTGDPSRVVGYAGMLFG